MKTQTLSKLALGITVALRISILEPSVNTQQPKRAISSVEKKWGVATTVPESSKGPEANHQQLGSSRKIPRRGVERASLEANEGFEQTEEGRVEGAGICISARPFVS